MSPVAPGGKTESRVWETSRVWRGAREYLGAKWASKNLEFRGSER